MAASFRVEIELNKPDSFKILLEKIGLIFLTHLSGELISVPVDWYKHLEKTKKYFLKQSIFFPFKEEDSVFYFKTPNLFPKTSAYIRLKSNGNIVIKWKTNENIISSKIILELEKLKKK